jgi:hypothetical protein
MWVPINQNNFDANGNLLHLDNIANLEWYYNNTLNKLTKADKTTQYNVYDYQGNRVRTDIKGISGFKYRKILSSMLILVLSNFIETISRLKVLVILKEDLPLSLLPTKLR